MITHEAKCTDEAKLFASQFLESFNEDEYWMDNPDATEADVHKARMRHLKGNAIAIPAARKICASCPMLSLGCKKAVLTSHPKDTYGVVAGMTLEARSAIRKADKREITVGDVFANPEGDITSQAAYALVMEYTRILEENSH